jgi:hypothetical protein
MPCSHKGFHIAYEYEIISNFICVWHKGDLRCESSWHQGRELPGNSFIRIVENLAEHTRRFSNKAAGRHVKHNPDSNESVVLLEQAGNTFRSWSGSTVVCCMCIIRHHIITPTVFPSANS